MEVKKGEMNMPSWENIARKIKNRSFAEANVNYNVERKKGERMLQEGEELQAQIEEMRRVILQLKNVAYIQDEFQITSHRKVIGRFLIWGKKFVRKFLRWYIHPIAEKQTIYNNANIETMAYIVECIGNLEDYAATLNKRIQEDKMQLTQVKEEIAQGILKLQQIEEAVVQLKQQLPIMVKEEVCEIRQELHEGLYQELQQSLYKDLHETLCNSLENQLHQNLQEALEGEFYKKVNDSLYRELTTEKINSTLNPLEKARGYADLIKHFNEPEDMQKLETLYREMMQIEEDYTCIAILCKDFRTQRDSEAIKKEAYTLFKRLKEEKVYKTYFISIEPNKNQEKDSLDDEVLYVTEEEVPNLLEQLKVKIVHVFESNPHIIFKPELRLLKYNIVFSGTAQLQMVGFNEYATNELVHLTDNGRLQILVESEEAKRQMEAEGIKGLRKITPIVEVPKIKKKKKTEQLVIGFASSPMAEDQVEDRGTYLLQEVIKNNPETKFKIAWRNEEIEIPEGIKQSTNVEIEYGIIDMKTFYSEVDAMIIPYISKENNHACSLSGIEAMELEKPVICTSISGISEKVMLIDEQCVSECNVESISEAIKYVDSQYEAITKKYSMYNKNQNINYLKQYTDAYQMISDEKVKTLAEWDYDLKTTDKYLVRGNKQIKSYYEAQSIVENYEETRFETYPMSVVNELERIAVDEMLKFYLKGRPETTQILDIASGTGRILEKLLDKGCCTVIDNSQEMLKVIMNKFGDCKKLNLIKDDFLEASIHNKFDVITSFRYIRHFGNDERKVIFNKIASLLNPNGLLIFDVPNLKAEVALRNAIGWQHFNIYDVFWTKESIQAELESYGFEVVRTVPIDAYYFEQLPDEYRQEAMSWTVVARYKGE